MTHDELNAALDRVIAAIAQVETAQHYLRWVEPITRELPVEDLEDTIQSLDRSRLALKSLRDVLVAYGKEGL